MKRELVNTPRFDRDARRWGKMHPQTMHTIRATLLQLSEDAFHPSLDSHKLKGALAPYRACSAGFDIRIVFEVIAHNGAEAIRLIGLGTHDDVY